MAVSSPHTIVKNTRNGRSRRTPPALLSGIPPTARVLARFDAPRHPARLFGCGFLAEGTLKFRAGSCPFFASARRVLAYESRKRALPCAPQFAGATLPPHP